MNLRPFGKTGLQVSEIGLGAWQLGNPDWNAGDPGEGLRIVRAALDAGCNFFDTAPGYGNGRSEELLGQALKGVRAQVILCTKFSHYGADGSRDFRPEHIRPVLEGSFRRLQTDFIDILLLHNPPRDLMDGRLAPELYAELETLKTAGKIRAYGVSLDWRLELETVTGTTPCQAAEVFFNAFHQEPQPAFRPAHEKGLGLIVKVPLDSGWLSGRYRATSTFDDVRKRWPPDVIARRGALVEKFAELVQPGTSLAHAALQYCLAQPEVSTVIPGAKTVAQVQDNFAAAETRLPEETVGAIRAFWESEIASDPLPW